MTKRQQAPAQKLAEIKKALKDSDEGFDENSESGKASIVMLSALEVGPNIRKLVKFTGIPVVEVTKFCSNLRKSGIFRGRKIACDWFGENGTISFYADTLIATGMLERV